MPSPLKTRWIATLGLILLTPIGLGLVRGSLGLDVAAMRAVVLVVALFVVERFVVPVAKLLISPGRRRVDKVSGDQLVGDPTAMPSPDASAG